MSGVPPKKKRISMPSGDIEARCLWFICQRVYHAAYAYFGGPRPFLSLALFFIFYSFCPRLQRQLSMTAAWFCI